MSFESRTQFTRDEFLNRNSKLAHRLGQLAYILHARDHRGRFSACLDPLCLKTKEVLENNNLVMGALPPEPKGSSA